MNAVRYLGGGRLALPVSEDGGIHIHDMASGAELAWVALEKVLQRGTLTLTLTLSSTTSTFARH